MVKINIITQDILKKNYDGYAFFVHSPFSLENLPQDVKNLFTGLDDVIASRNFTGRAGGMLELTGIHLHRGVYLILLGLGEKSNKISVETYRRLIGRIVRHTETHRVKSMAFVLPDPALFALDYERMAYETAIMLHKASYHFDEFITNPDRRVKMDADFIIQVPQEHLNQVNQGIDKGVVLANSINLARNWCDMPGSLLTPKDIADKSEVIANKYGLKATIFNQDDVIKMGMGGLYGVSRGSTQECRLVILEYKTQKSNAPTIALVGKGITFDTGGLCIKPSAAMETMKDDMAGAAVVIATMQALAQLKPDINVIGLAPLSENMPSGSATKPGDILRFYNGKTAEVKDTDAEGRLVLADALAYAVKNYKLDAIIDIATLTGACAHALGHFYCALLSKHDALVDKFYAASAISGDRVWRLPLDDDYKPAIASEVADMQNIGSPRYKGGTITAAFFLQNFVGDVPWVHLDIAGTAFGVPDMTYLRPGATGFGIRLFTDLIMNWK